MFRSSLKAAALALAAFAGGAVCASWVGATSEQQTPYALLQQLARVLVLVENEYVDTVDRTRLTEGAIKGLVSELDPHSSYLPPQAFERFIGDTRGRFGGIGVEVDFRSDEVLVISAIEGSPASRAGIRAGDIIVAIDRVNVRGKTTDELVERMRGTPGTTVQIGVRRVGYEKIQNYFVQREVISVASLSWRTLRSDIGYVRIKQFQRGTHAELLESIAQLRAQSALSGVILDLRNNPGGLVREAVASVDEFLDSGGIYSTRRRSEIVDKIDAKPGGALLEQPLVVLVNEYSASAAELVAGALQDNDRATVVGAPTFGKGSVQSIIELPDNAALRLTTQRYYTPNGSAIQARGIRPDVLVEAAYVEDDSFGVVRESDLENHLAPEAGSKPPPVPREKPRTAPASDGVSPTHLGVARDVPADPTGGPDFALSIGYQILRAVLTKPN